MLWESTPKWVSRMSSAEVGIDHAYKRLRKFVMNVLHGRSHKW
jgi:hypothetical protein